MVVGPPTQGWVPGWGPCRWLSDRRAKLTPRTVNVRRNRALKPRPSNFQGSGVGQKRCVQSVGDGAQLQKDMHVNRRSVPVVVWAGKLLRGRGRGSTYAAQQRRHGER